MKAEHLLRLPSGSGPGAAAIAAAIASAIAPAIASVRRIIYKKPWKSNEMLTPTLLYGRL